MRKFNLEEAKAGARLCTRDGRSARVICWDRAYPKSEIVALVSAAGQEYIFPYHINGKFTGFEESHFNDLMIKE